LTTPKYDDIKRSAVKR